MSANERKFVEGIGAEIARKLAAEGAGVAVNYASANSLTAGCD
jgi:NAD(P)-dependent dehydrogenase (short-subunit alcohol dehydrogenase family)